tara:strand:- start:2074 stop:3192 length:1119 start_codon:yes stop_codon:yes gene_type:complete
MINPLDLKNILKTQSINFFSGVPDSCCLEFCKSIENDKNIENIVAVNEGNAVAIGLGHYLSTKKIPCIYLQNSGLGNATDPLTNLCNKEVYNIPMLLIIGWRGAPGIKDEAQHIIQGKVLLNTLKSYNIPNIQLKNKINKKEIINLIKKIKSKNIIGAILVKPKTFQKIQSKKKYISKKIKNNKNYLRRSDVIENTLNLIEKNTKIIGSVGFNSREIYQIRKERKINKGKDFLLIGGMGHTFAVSQIIAKNNPKNQVVCIDGDGSFLMHLGSFLTNEIFQKNLKYLLINNNSHESIGNIKINKKINYEKIAKAFNFKKYFYLKEKKLLKRKIKSFLKCKGPAFLEASVNLGTLQNLERPKKFKVIKKNFLRK